MVKKYIFSNDLGKDMDTPNKIFQIFILALLVISNLLKKKPTSSTKEPYLPWSQKLTSVCQIWNIRISTSLLFRTDANNPSTSLINSLCRNDCLPFHNSFPISPGC